MRVIPPQLLADLQADATAIAYLWTIEMKDGRMIRGTEHDMDITLVAPGDAALDKYAGTYYAVANVTLGDVVSSTDLSVDNLEVSGAVADTLFYNVLDVSVDAIESGLLDTAPVTVLCCNWKAPEHGFFEVKGGVLGTINHDSDGKYTTEVRGLTQFLAQTLIRTFSATCNVVTFGDRRCKFNVPAVTITGTVATDTDGSRQRFGVTLTLTSPVYPFGGGTITFTSGANAGYFREVKLDPNANGGILEVWDQFPEDVAPTDAFTLSPGCDRSKAMCKDVYNNLPNNKAYGMYIPGIMALTAGPATAREFGG